MTFADINISVRTKPSSPINKKLNFEKSPAESFNFNLIIDEKKKYQKIRGFGYSFEHSSCQNLMRLPKEIREKALKLLVSEKSGANLNLWRICIGASDFTGTERYTYDDLNDLKEDMKLKNFSIEKDKEIIIPILKAALKINPHILFFASPWSPPAWMKDSKRICGGKLLPKYYKSYAEYLVKFLQLYEENGLPIYTITVQNEPGVDNPKMPSCKWAPEEERDFIKDYLGPALEEAHLKTKIWCYDHNFGFIRTPTSYPEVVLKDKEAAKFIDGIAFHHYSGKPEYMLLYKEQYPEANIYFTEGSVFGLRGARKIAKYFRCGAQSYNGWVPFLDTNHGPNNGPHRAKRTIIERKVPENTVLVNFDYFIVAHYSKFIQRGAHMIYSKRIHKRSLSEVSFLNPDGTIVSILTNGTRRKKKVQLEWRGKYLLFILPKKSIATLSWQI